MQERVTEAEKRLTVLRQKAKEKQRRRAERKAEVRQYRQFKQQVDMRRTLARALSMTQSQSQSQSDSGFPGTRSLISPRHFTRGVCHMTGAGGGNDVNEPAWNKPKTSLSRRASVGAISTVISKPSHCSALFCGCEFVLYF